MVLYSTNEWKGYGKQNYYHNEYEREGDKVVKYKCGRQRSFDGEESNWHTSKRKTQSWSVDDPSRPDWLKSKL